MPNPCIASSTSRTQLTSCVDAINRSCSMSMAAAADSFSSVKLAIHSSLTCKQACVKRTESHFTTNKSHHNSHLQHPSPYGISSSRHHVLLA